MSNEILREHAASFSYDAKDSHQSENKPQISLLELTASAQQIGPLLAVLQHAGFTFMFPEPRWATNLRNLVDNPDTAIPKTNTSVQDAKAVSTKPPLSIFSRAPRPLLQAATAIAVAYAGITGGAKPAFGQEQITPPPSASVRNAEKTSQPIQLSVATTDTYGPHIDLATLEQNTPNIPASVDVLDALGNAIKTYSISKNTLYERHLDTTSGAWTQNVAVKAIPLVNTTSLTSSADGKTIIFGGENQRAGSGGTALAISFDGGQNIQSITWPFTPVSGAVVNISPLTSTSFAGNNDNVSTNVESQFLIKIDTTAKTAALSAISFTDQNNNSVNLGHAFGFGIADVTAPNATFFSGSTMNVQSGFIEGTINTDTANGIITAQHPEEGSLWQWSLYNDTAGHQHLLSSNVYASMIYDNDLATGTATSISSQNLGDQLGIPGYEKGFLELLPLVPFTDSNNQLHVFFAGCFSSSTVLGSQMIIGSTTLPFDKNNITFAYLPTDLSAAVQAMQIQKNNGSVGLLLRFSLNKPDSINLGDAFLPIDTANGTFLPNAEITFDSAGFNPTNASPTPTIVGMKPEIYLPIVGSNAPSSW